MRIETIPFIRALFGYRCFQQTVSFEQGPDVVQWYWIKPRDALRLKTYQPGELWHDGRRVTMCRWERL